MVGVTLLILAAVTFTAESTVRNQYIVCRSVEGIYDPNQEIQQSNATSVRGPMGRPGKRGPRGLQGPKGSQGPLGMLGPKGLQGPIGLQGPVGLQGPKGLQGPSGPKGIKGSKGSQGLKGTRGQKGARGPSGSASINWAEVDRRIRFQTRLSRRRILCRGTCYRPGK
uniref:collagen alpha-1(I) chain-like n=1 Tax=Ciona intestinalis TaxID=7719 RepID=UPI00089DC3AD|nr:collagen alpha-1(I) chain-like [Ciona intestinalis]|eukprot:XP_018668173.1 collagen alpha-1(I) chain-like [Ciona intestinalis]